MEYNPIVFIDADEDDQLLFKRILLELVIPNPVLFFADGQAALAYLMTGAQVPFLIISEMSLPGMSGIELRQQLEQNEQLRRMSIPFVFMTYPVADELIEQAYELTIQGLFEKKSTYEGWKAQVNDIIAYWTECYQPKRLTN